MTTTMSCITLMQPRTIFNHESCAVLMFDVSRDRATSAFLRESGVPWPPYVVAAMTEMPNSSPASSTASKRY